MKLLRSAIGLATLIALLAMPALATAGEPVVPPGNSAATQYTETFPTSGGNVEVNGSIDGGGTKQQRSPEEVLGKKTAKTLESDGKEGRAVARLATEAAPATGAAGGSAGAGGEGPQGSGKGSGHGTGGSAGGGNGGGSNGGSGGSSGNSSGGQLPSGSSAAGQVVSKATLSTSGEMGVFLPIVLVAALIWALLFAWRRRRDGEPSPS